MLTIPVGDLLQSFTGDTKIFSFDGTPFDGYYDDLNFLDPLVFTIKLTVLDDGISGTLSSIKSYVQFQQKKREIFIISCDRVWKLQPKSTDLDDVLLIDPHDLTINLKPVIYEEIIMALN